MPNRDFDSVSGPVTHLLPSKETQPEAVQPSSTAERDPVDLVTCRAGDNSCAHAHASTLSRSTASGPASVNRSLLQLQRQYGNRYVERVLSLSQATVDRQQQHDVDRGSDSLNRALSARAFTTGQDIFFREGAYQPGSSIGRELIAHELTHVVQQNGNAVKRAMSVSQPGDPHEVEAEQTARAVMQQESTGSHKKEEDEKEEVSASHLIPDVNRQPEATTNEEEEKKKHRGLA